MLARVAAVCGTTAVVLSIVSAPASAAGPASVTGYAPSAAAQVGSTLDIQGSGLDTVTHVLFPTQSGTVDVSPTDPGTSSTDVHVVVPQGARSGPISVSDGSATPAQGPQFTVLPPTASLHSSVGSVVYPATALLTAKLTTAGVGVPDQSGSLQSQPVGATSWHNVAQATTDSTGQVHFTVRPLTTTVYRVVFAATVAYQEADSNTVRITQHPKVTMYLPTVAPILTVVKVKGNVKPAQTGVVRLQRLVNGVWRLASTANLTSTGHYVLTMRLPSKSTFTFRVKRPADAHQAGAVSTTAKVLGVSRTLHSGLSGPDVTALQRRLAALHYDIGRITGTYNFDTMHAVTAFEKVQRLPRNGVVGTAVWKALGAPLVPHLRHPMRGAAVEVNLTRQVLLYAVNGKVVRIFDASTGGGYYYTGSDGTQQRAITPTGHFAIRYKVNHWVTSKLGVLYRPAYFNYSGYAIHGEPEVPSYPASHGCVRITVPAMDRFYGKLVNGESVWIYK
jgi:N-acetylmuramoyl-L-alanine amidase